jgi:hypothetical protein
MIQKYKKDDIPGTEYILKYYGEYSVNKTACAWYLIRQIRNIWWIGIHVHISSTGYYEWNCSILGKIQKSIEHIDSRDGYNHFFVEDVPHISVYCKGDFGPERAITYAGEEFYKWYDGFLSRYAEWWYTMAKKGAIL